MKQQRVLFLIDGIDEVPENLRTELMDMIAEFKFANKENRFLITGRPHGIDDRAKARFGENLFEIQSLDNEKIINFIKKWFKIVSLNSTVNVHLTAEGMISDIYKNEHISKLIKNPLLLTVVCILYCENKQLSNQRSDLYNRFILNLLNQRFHDPRSPVKKDKILEFLMPMAFEAQNKNRKTIEVYSGINALQKSFTKNRAETDSQYNSRIEELFKEIEPISGLFSRLTSGELEFIHLSFQEFLAAKYMLNVGDIDWRLYVGNSWWEETLLLYFGLLNLESKIKSNEIVKEILTLNNPYLAAKALCEFHPSRREERIVSLVRERLYHIIDSNPESKERFQAGTLVGKLGDIRIRDENMVLVPEGEFIRGSDRCDDTKPVKDIFLDSYKICIYTVTNQEFKRFVDDGGYHKEKFWTHEGWQWRINENISEPLYWYDRQMHVPNFPVVGISWYEAVAYANWLAKKTGKPYRLPTEAEWEKAARGTDGREYPWGNDLYKNMCNTDQSGLLQTSPVGIFPKDKSPYGCFDMAGNIFEWCLDWYRSDYYKDSQKKNPNGPVDGFGRVLRGGNWTSGSSTCSSTYRYFYHPANRITNVGFRLAMPLKHSTNIAYNKSYISYRRY